MKNTKLILLFGSIILSIQSFGQLNGFIPQIAPVNVKVDSAICGTSPDAINQLNQDYFHSINSFQKINQASGDPFTPIGTFPSAQVQVCGSFRIYYEDFQVSPADGFAHPGVGAARRNTLCAVLNYIESVFRIPPGTTLALHVRRSWTTTNFPAPANSTNTLALAGPYYPLSYSTTPGIYAGNMFNHIVTGNDPDANNYDAVMRVNFNNFNYWDDFNTTNVSCRYDLYSVLLHEITHTLGWLSNIRENQTTFLAESGGGNNQYSLFDWRYLFKGNIVTNGPWQKLLLGTPASPQINAVINTPNTLRSTDIWMNNLANPRNNPVYSGTNDAFAIPTVLAGSLLSHLDNTPFAYGTRQRFSPGFSPTYVMNPTVDISRINRTLTLQEIRYLLALTPISGIGYTLNPLFAISTSINSVNTNAQIILTNISPITTKQVATYPIIANWPETLPADVPSWPNNQTLVINLAANPNLVDANGDARRVFPGSLFNIRGCGSGGNNTNLLTLNAAGTQITYTPRPNFIGRAQFGFHLWDGKEKGAFYVYTIDVIPGNVVNTPANELVLNGGFEEGTEVCILNTAENLPNSSYIYTTEAPYMAGTNFSDAHPFSYLSNFWNVAGGDIIQNSRKVCSSNNNLRAAFGTFLTATPGIGGFQHPAPASGQRYHILQHAFNFSTLAQPAQNCRRYTIEFDINFSMSGLVAGNTYNLQLEFTANPGILTAAPAINHMVPLAVPVTTPSGWQHFTFSFPYCGINPSSFINLRATGNKVLVDNISLIEDVTPAPPLTVNAGQNVSICAGGSTTLNAVPANGTCAYTYSWQPATGLSNTNTANPVASPATTTTYTVTVSDGCRTAMSNVTVTVNSATFCCTAPAGGITFQSGTLSSNVTNPLTGNVAINGLFIINNTFSFNNCTVLLGKNARIQINPGQTLNINNSILSACGDMWDGIYIPDNTSHLNVNNSVIRDAENAIVSQNGGDFQVLSTTLDKNFVHIDVRPFSGTHTGTVQSSQLTCVGGNSLKAPHTGQRTSIGIKITDVAGISVISPGAFNIFDNMDFGIFASNLNAANSNLVIQRNTFRNLSRPLTICPGPGPCGPLPGIAIFTTGNLTNTLIVGGTLATRNNFQSCFQGVEVQDYKTATINNNVFTNPNAGNLNNRLAGLAVTVIHNSIFPPSGVINVNNNIITNWNTGVRYFLNDQSILATTALHINFNRILNSFTGLANNAIVVESIIPSVALSLTNNWEVKNNTITNGTTGILIRNITLPPVDVLTNNINIKLGGAPVGQRYGIRLQNSRNINIANLNRITSPNNAATIFGISVEISPNTRVDNNRITGTGVGINCLGNSNLSTIKCNIMTACRRGILLNNATIGNQLPGGVAADNQWIGTITPNADIVDINSSAPTIWTYRLLPTYIPQHLPSVAIQDNPVFIPVPSNCPIVIPPCPGDPSACQNILADIVQNNVLPPVFAQENQVMSDEFIYSSLKSDNSLMQQGTAQDLILQQFYNKTITTTLGKFAGFNEAIANKNLTYASTLNASVNPVSLIEQNQQMFNQIFLSALISGNNSFSQQQINLLTGIAQKCPLTGGRAVYQARSLLGFARQEVINYEDNCEPENNTKFRRNDASLSENDVHSLAIKMYPNPANKNVMFSATLQEEQKGVLEIYDMVGNKFGSYVLKEGNNLLNISTTNLSPGVYVYKVVVSGELTHSDKLIIIK